MSLDGVTVSFLMFEVFTPLIVMVLEPFSGFAKVTFFADSFTAALDSRCPVKTTPTAKAAKSRIIRIFFMTYYLLFNKTTYGLFLSDFFIAYLRKH